MYTQCTQVMLKKLAKITKLTYSHTIFKIQKEEKKIKKLRALSSPTHKKKSWGAYLSAPCKTSSNFICSYILFPSDLKNVQ